MRPIPIAHAFGKAAIAAAILVVAGSCDRQPLAPITPVNPSTVATDSSRPPNLARLRCTADRIAKVVTCETPGEGTGTLADIIVGGQNSYVKLTSSNVDYNVGTQQFSFNVTLRNLIPQAMGTTDGTTPDPSGIRIFFDEGPVATAGSGLMSVVNPDGVGTFTGTNQPYFRYPVVLNQFDVSPAKTWILAMPNTVQSYSFAVYVSAPVKFPNGYVEVAGNPAIRADGVRQLTGTSRTNVGNEVAGTTITWSTSDTTVATVDATGLVLGVREGTVTMGGTDGPRSGTLAMTVSAITRVWSGSATTDYSTALNWTRNVIPTLNDSLDIPAVASARYPQLASNVTAAGLTLEAGTSLLLGAFNLTLSKSVSVAASTTFSSTSGRLILTGVAGTLAAATQIPRLSVVSGSYSLTTDVAVKNLIQVDGGRITSSGFKLQVDNAP
ncbi:MAG: large protein [Gemmatimonadetes bacterium]|nr:large protein [Gemmatimonadota bacterium]